MVDVIANSQCQLQSVQSKWLCQMPLASPSDLPHHHHPDNPSPPRKLTACTVSMCTPPPTHSPLVSCWVWPMGDPRTREEGEWAQGICTLGLDFPGKNTGVGCHALLQGIFPTQASEPRSPASQVDSLPSEPPGKPFFLWTYLQLTVSLSLF